MTRLFAWYLILVVVVFLGTILLLNDDISVNRINTTTSINADVQLTHARQAHYSKLTILPGELPGFTGWVRPASTLAHYFELEPVLESAIAGQNWTIFITCHHPKGRLGGSMFNVRAYGRSILPGIIKDYRNGTYSITILPFDIGTYQLEIVVAFSNPPSWESLPTKNEPGYEGYLLPGFPLEFTVLKTDNWNSHEPASRLCTVSEMSETSTTSAISRGQWRVKEKMVEHAYQDKSPSLTRQNENLGILMEYVPTIGCRLMSEAEVQNREILADAIHNSKLPAKPMHVIFIGDSNMRLQRNMFEEYFGGLSTTHIRTHDGITVRLPEIKEKLNELAQKDEHFFLIFNTGIHDVSHLCFTPWRFTRDRIINVTDDEFSCADQYRRSLKEFVDVVKDFPSLLKVWQTTTAAWPKWGVWSVAWPAISPQTFPLTTQSCEYFNEIAWEILSPSHIPVMDAYWLTVIRPDHREVTTDNAISGHLVHAGPEIYSVLTRKWAMMILERIQTER